MSLLRTLLSRRIPITSRGFHFSLSHSPSNTLRQYNHQLERFSHSVSASRQLRTSTSLSTQRLSSSHETLLFTEKARKRLKEVLAEGSFLRVIVDSGGCSGFQYKFELDKKLESDDIEIHYSDDDPDGKTVLVIDPTSLHILRGSTVDYEMELIRSAFRIVDNPQAEQGCSCGASFNVKID